MQQPQFSEQVYPQFKWIDLKNLIKSKKLSKIYMQYR